ncbi:hypothetical protein ZEAMMB73_Zm00001d013321 [Zea mays]|uniref:Uncharacterized protein n=1 Tax=Zea mays TaxID=4577 RepID=A0A1D6GI47_MAIZE|nr:hypothetical protein ZEAMMB73_Zm00001d013321 [Zea mays]AQK63117.1 hypothetical protein ZEAMMB73_Zm00001d013321 [Zea mays]
MAVASQMVNPTPPTYEDGKHAYPNESSESPYFGSSVDYGVRQFYSSNLQCQGFMAYVQTDSGKTTTFYFPITGIIMQPARMPQ